MEEEFKLDENMQVEYIDVNDIKEALFNPPVRTEKSNLRLLEQSILKHGILVPLIITQDNKLVDGHRRLAICLGLGIERVPVVRVDGSREELFTEVNGTSRKLSNGEFLFAYNHGASVPLEQQRHIDILTRMVGTSYLRKLEKSKSGAKGVLTSFRRYLAWMGKDVEPDFLTGKNEFANKFARWMIDHSANWSLRIAMVADMDRQTVIDCIEKNIPLPKTKNG